MKSLNYFAVFYLLLSFAACGQATTKQPVKNLKTALGMDTAKLTNSTVKKAIDALQKADKTTWFSLFTSDAELFDDGNKINFKSFFDKALGHEHFTSIDKTEDNGLTLYGKFHSDQWGDFKTYFKFYINVDGKINRLDIGQASY